MKGQGKWWSWTPNQWKNKGLNVLVTHRAKQEDAAGFLSGREQILEGFSEGWRVGLCGKRVCVPLPSERGRKLLARHLELASGNNMLQRVYKSCAQQPKKRQREWEEWLQGAMVRKGNTKEDKRYFVCGMLCRPSVVLKKKSVPCRTSVSASIQLHTGDFEVCV